MKPGDPVKVRYARDGKESELEFPLSSREELLRVRQEALLKETGMKNLPDRRSLDPTAQMGSSLSGNASGYPKAVQSDLTIDANECGGPVVDATGRLVAVSYATARRVLLPGVGWSIGAWAYRPPAEAIERRIAEAERRRPAAPSLGAMSGDGGGGR